MDPVEQAVRIAEEVSRVLEQMIESGPDLAKGLPPEWATIQGRLQEAEQVLRKEMNDLIQQAQAQAAAHHQTAAQVRAKAEARMAAFTHPPAKPAPLLALPFSEKFISPTADLRSHALQLLALPARVLDGKRV